MHKTHALVTNDDGFDSGFLRALVNALLPHFDVSVAAPASEQSWIGRAVSRRSKIKVIQIKEIFPAAIQAWKITGTPTDCVNIALGNLLSKPPAVVISGINIGFNTSEALILSSGTIAGALEGSLWGIPSIAFSQCIPHHEFEKIASSKGLDLGNFQKTLDTSAAHAADLAVEVMLNPPPNHAVTNINFPSSIHANSTIEETYPTKIRLKSLYEKDHSDQTYKFRYSDGQILDANPQTDRAALLRGSISRSILDFSKIGVQPNKT